MSDNIVAVEPGARQLSLVPMFDFWSKNDRMSQDLYRVVSMVADAKDVSPDNIRCGRGRSCRKLRQLVIYLTSICYGHPICTVAGIFGMSRNGGSYAGHAVEDRRDDHAYDSWLDQLELQLLQSEL